MRLPPKTAKRTLRREAHTARRTKTIITIAIIAITIMKVGIIKTEIKMIKIIRIKIIRIKITTITVVKATTAKTRNVALSSFPDCSSSEEAVFVTSVPV